MVLGALAANVAQADVPRVIYDTDIGSSMCDLSALDMAVQLDELGYMKLIGVMLDRPDFSDPAGQGRFLEFTDRTLASLGRNDIPIASSMSLLDASGIPRKAGVYTPYWSIVDMNKDGEPALPLSRRNDTAIPDALALYRRLLHDADGRTVSICAVGFFNNLIALMKSSANDRGDGIPMTGMELIREKVKGLWVMAGCFNNNGIAQDGHGEYNVWTDIPSAKYVFENWPGEIIFSPWEVGLKLEYKSEWLAHDYPAGGRSPAMHWFQEIWGNPTPDVDPFPNRLWDNAAVLNVIVGESAVPLSGRGTVKVRDSDGSGVTEFTPDENGNCRYQVADEIEVEQTMKFIRGISTADPKKKIPRVIIDTDLGSSVDDLVALDLAASGHWNGDINLIGVMMDRPDGSNPPDDPRGPGEFLKFADAYMTTLNMDNVPIGRAVKPLSDIKVFTPYWTLVNSNDTVTGKALMRGSGRDIARFPDAVTLYRRLLNASPSNSVDICQIGFFGNLVALLDSKEDFGDGISKTGKELIREKVRALRVMAGCFEGDGVAQGDHGEFNVWGDIESVRRIFGEWPGKIVCSPWEVGLKLKYEPDWMRLDFPYGCCNEVLHAFDRYWHEPAPTDEFPNRMWDAMTVAGVVREDVVPLSPNGTIDVDDGTGLTRFTQKIDGRCRYQYLEGEADARALMDDIREVLSDGRSASTWAGRDLDKMNCLVDLRILLAGEGLQTSNELDAAAFALCEKELANGVAYAEIRFAPEGHGALSAAESVDAVLAGLRRSALDARLVLLGAEEACRKLIRTGVVGYDDGSGMVFSFEEGVSRDRAVEFCPADDTERSFMELLGGGVKVTVNTGTDPETGLRAEWKKLIGRHALMPREMKAALLNAAGAAFADEATKAALRAKIEAAFLPTGSADDPWVPGTDLTAWVENGTLRIVGPGEVRSTPWTARADEITAIVTDVRMTGFAAEMLSALPNAATVNGLTLAQLKSLAPEPTMPEGTIPVSKTELEAAGAATVTIVDGTAYVGVSVRTNGDLTAEQKSWGKVKFGKDVKVDVSEDGTELVIPVPANAEKGFMVLGSGDAGK